MAIEFVVTEMSNVLMFFDVRFFWFLCYISVSEVDVLEKEAKDMEFQLKQLQSRMQQQQIEDDAVVKTGGCRWKSARPDKGSVLTYAKDVQDKYRSKYGAGEDPVFRDPPPMRPPSEMTTKSGSIASGGIKTTDPIKSNSAPSKTSFHQKGDDV